MKELQPNDHRNVVLVGHGGAGKTTLAEAMLFCAHAIPRMGSVGEGTTALDYLAEEQKKGSVALTMGVFQHGGKAVTLLDTPGFPEYEAEVAAGLRAADAALVVVAADAGVEVGTELTWKASRRRRLPAAIVINGMEKEKADPQAAVASIRERLGPRAVPVQIPLGAAADFRGVVDVLQEKAILFKPDGASETGPVPADMQAAAQEARASLMESAAESSEELMNKYFEEGELSPEDLVQGLRMGIAQGDLYPVYFASAVNGQGAGQVLGGIVDLLPGPAEVPPPRNVVQEDGEGEELAVRADGPLAALVFKATSEAHVGEIFFVKVFSGVLEGGDDVYNSTRQGSEKVSQLFHVIGKARKETPAISAGGIGIAVKLRNSGCNDTLCERNSPILLEPVAYPTPVIDFAVRTVKVGEEDKMATGLAKLSQEDPTFRYHYEEETRETLVSGMGEAHLALMTNRLKERFGVAVELHAPRVPYRETIKGNASVQGRYKKQTGGRGQFGDVWVRLEPLPMGSGFEFVNEIVGGVVPSRFIPAVEKGIHEAMERGIVAGYRVVDIKATLYDGSYHSVDSSEAAFKVAGSLAFKSAATQSSPTLLEPFLSIRVNVPKEYMGDVMGDLSSRRGKIMGMESEGDNQIINAQVPQAEMQRYSVDLRAMTQGRGTFERAFSHYAELPKELQEKVVAEAKQGLEETAKK